MARKGKISQPEAHLQIQAVQWFKKTHPQFASSIIYVNNNSHSIQAGKINKLKGILAGFPDLFLFLTNSRYSGLAIELKAKGRKPSGQQLIIHARLVEEGYKVAVINNLAAFKTLIADYIAKS